MHGSMAALKRMARSTTAADVAAILELFAAAALCPNSELPALEWKYWQPRVDWAGARSFLLSDDDLPVAHGAIIPNRCAWAAQRMSMIHVIDWAARPGAVGAGVALMKHIGRQAQALLAIGGSAQTQQILPLIGFRDAGVVTGYVRTMHPTRLWRSGRVPSGKLLARFARSVIWTLGARSASGSEWQVRRLDAADVAAVAHVLPVPTRGLAVLERSVEQFRYVLSCPIVPLALYAVERAGRVRGYFLLASAPGQVRIVDCWVDSDERADWRALILCAVAQARTDGQAAEVTIWANDPLLAEALAECGFHARQCVAVRLRAAAGTPMPPLPLRLQMLDSDAAFLHEGLASYWA
jgi:hypothetical protein